MVRSLRGAPLRFARALFVLGTVATLAFGAVALAAGDDRTTTEALLKEIEGSPRKDVAEPHVARSRAALDRAAKLRASGDETHAKLADGVARSWAEAARDVARAAAAEESAANDRRAANDAGVLADRERALLEESIAQSGRLRAQLEAAEREGKDQPARTSTTAAKAPRGASEGSSRGSSPSNEKDDAGARPQPKPTAKDAGVPPAPKADGGAR